MEERLQRKVREFQLNKVHPKGYYEVSGELSDARFLPATVATLQ
jgi:hypothetical protein